MGVGEFLVLFPVLVRKKVSFTENRIFVGFVSGMRLPVCSKLVKNPKNINDITIFRHDVNVNSFWIFFVSLVNFSCWSKFYVNIITGSGIMATFFYKRLTRNPNSRNTPVLVLPNIGRLGRYMDTKFGTNFSNRMLMNAGYCQGYRFYRVWVTKGKSTVAVKLPPLAPPRLGLSTSRKFGASCQLWLMSFVSNLTLY